MLSGMHRLADLWKPLRIAILAGLMPAACPLPAAATSGAAARDSVPAELFVAPPSSQFT